MSTEYAQINSALEKLCARFQVPLSILNINSLDSPRVETRSTNGIHTIVLNTARIPLCEYASYAGYYVRKHLLPMLRLETDRLILRRYLPQDADACFRLLSNEEDAYLDCCKAFTSQNEEFYDHVALFGERETQYMVILKENWQLIGTVNVFPDDSRAVEAMEIGYSIARAYQRKGYAFEALSALLHLLQNDLYLEMVTAGVLPENTASVNLLAKLNFCKEGLRHKAVWHEGLDGPVDLIYFYRDRKDA